MNTVFALIDDLLIHALDVFIVCWRFQLLFVPTRELSITPVFRPRFSMFRVDFWYRTGSCGDLGNAVYISYEFTDLHSIWRSDSSFKLFFLRGREMAI